MSLPSDLVIVFTGAVLSTTTVSGCPSRNGSYVDAAGLTLTQSTSANRPSIGYRSCAAGPGLVFGGSGAPLYSQPTWLTSGTTVILGSAWTLEHLGSADGAGCFYEWGNTASGQGVQLKDASLKIVGASGTMTATFASVGDNVDAQLELKYNGTLASVALTRNGVAVTLSKSGSDPGSLSSSLALTLGADAAHAAPLTGYCGFHGYDLRVLSSGESADVLAVFSSTPWYLPTAGLSVSRTFVTIGDSIPGGFLTNSSALDPTYAFPNIAALMLGSRFAGGSSNNFAVGGAQLTTGAFSIANQWTSLGGATAAAAAAGNPILTVIFGGINDVSAGLPSLTTAPALAATIYGEMATVTSDVVTTLNGLSFGGGSLKHLVIPCCITTGVQEAQAGCVRQVNRLYRTFLASQGTANAPVSPIDFGLGSDVVVGQSIGIENGYQTAPAYNVANFEHPAKPGHREIGGRMVRFLLSLGY